MMVASTQRMQCARQEKCNAPVVFDSPQLCKEHFFAYFEKKVFDTIKRYRLCTPQSNVLVGVSGGKDSLVVAHLLSKYCTISLLAIDEGIPGYREHTLQDLQRFNAAYGPFDLKIVSYREEIGAPLSEILNHNDVNPCSVCGTFRRHLLNKYSTGFPLVATGHNRDDEAQAIVMNIIRGQPAMLGRIGPKTEERAGFTIKIKPLYFCSEKEVLAYAFLKGFDLHFAECPHATLSFRAQVRDALNEHEKEFPGTKERIIESFMRLKTQLQIDAHAARNKKARPSLRGTTGAQESLLLTCASCGFPSAKKECAACFLKHSLQLA